MLCPEFGVPILKHGTPQRIAYAGATTVIELQPYGDATFEIKSILKEIVG
jgi:hypothetical protein